MLSHVKISCSLLLITLLLFFGCKKQSGQVSSLPSLKPLHIEKPFDKPDTTSGKLFDILTSKSTGLNFSNDIRMSYDLENWSYPYLYIGAGIAVGDINGDQLPDIFLSGNLSEDKLFLNKGGLNFEDISLSSGISKNNAWSTGATMVDINHDGFLDIYLCRSWHTDNATKRQNLFYINNGDLTFSEKAFEMGLADTTYSIHASFFDYDLDGDLDVYIVGHPLDWNDRRKYNNHEKIERGQNTSDRLYRNNGNLTFEEISTQAGINNHGYGLSVSTGDINADHWPDILVTNDWGMPDHLYLNQQNGQFKDVSKSYFTKNSFSAMGSDIADFNNDGYYDIAVAEMDFNDNRQHKSFIHSRLGLSDLRTMEQSGYHSQYYRNTLQLNNGDATFSEIALAAGTSSSDWSWSMLFMDADNDGFQDLFISNGNYRTTNLDERPQIQKLRSAARRQDKAAYNKIVETFDTVHLKSPNTIFKNNGDLTFSKMNQTWGTNWPSISYGAAYADLDLDGDLDILTNNTNESVFVYRNNATNLFPKNHFLQVELNGPLKNISGLGTEVILNSKRKSQRQSMINTRGYESCSPFILHFGLEQDSIIDELIILWPDGKTQTLNDVACNQRIIVDYKDAKKPLVKPSISPPLLFTQKSNYGLDFIHQENKHDDFYRNRLIPKMYSRGGPSIAIADVNGDGLEDCFIGGAAEQSSGLYLQTEELAFSLQTQQTFEQDKAYEDMGVLFFDADGDKDVDLYIASGGSDFLEGDSLLQDRLYINDGTGYFQKSKQLIPNSYTNHSVVSAADFDQDGDLDLFVGGQIRSGYFPDSPTSVLLENKDGKFINVTDKWAPEIKKAGMVQASLWTDINNDQLIDLIIIGEWMPIKVFKNTGKKFIEITKAAGLAHTSGWWNSIVSADFDQDGDMDYVLGNQGENFRYKPKPGFPLKAFYGDFDEDKDIDFVLSYYYHDKQYPITYLDDLGGEMAFVRDRFKSYTHYGMSTTEEVLGSQRMKKSKTLKADLFSSIYLENKGNEKFVWHLLPVAAQLSNIYGMLVGDFDEDGNQDVLVQGNYSAFQPQFEKQDGITGLLLKGNGEGKFEAINSIKSGFWNRGEGRALVRLNAKSGPSLILSGNNNRELNIHTMTSKEDWLISLKPDEYSGKVTFKNQSTQRLEFYYGEAYLSQNSRNFYLNSKNIEHVEIYTYTGGKRILKPK